MKKPRRSDSQKAEEVGPSRKTDRRKFFEARRASLRPLFAGTINTHCLNTYQRERDKCAARWCKIVAKQQILPTFYIAPLSAPPVFFAALMHRNTGIAQSPASAQPVCIAGAPVDGNTIVRIRGTSLTLRQLGGLFADAHNFTPLFCSPSSSKRGRPRSSSDALGKTVERAAVATATAALFAIFNGLPTLRQLRLIHQRVVQHRTSAGLPCDDDAASDDSLSALDFLYAVLELELPQRQWPVAVKLLRVPLRESMQRVIECKRLLRDALAVLPLSHGAFAHPTWLIGLWAELCAPQLEQCRASDSQRYLVLKLGGDGSSGFKVNGAPSNIETLNFHPVSLTTGHCRARGAMSLLGAAIAPEQRSALEELWQPVCTELIALPRINWNNNEWRQLRLHSGHELLLSLHLGADGGCALKLLGLSSALTRRDRTNPACCILCDASYDDAVRVQVGTPRTTAVQIARGEAAQRAVNENSDVAAAFFNTTVRLVKC